VDLARIVTEGNFVHEYRRFVQTELDARKWKPAEFASKAGLHRQLVWKILNDDRPRLGQMPDESTMEAIANGFGIHVDRVRTAAARALRGYEDDGTPLSNDLSVVPDDVLLTEIRRRFEQAHSGAGLPVATPNEGKNRRVVHRKRGAELTADEAAVEDRHENRQ
jgi:transcriptional regulator with XRE-family HTH domain